jgi:hypothetical protein
VGGYSVSSTNHEVVITALIAREVAMGTVAVRVRFWIRSMGQSFEGVKLMKK